MPREEFTPTQLSATGMPIPHSQTPAVLHRQASTPVTVCRHTIEPAAPV
ncbi:MAG: hypothetical protein KME26_18785 [Oscillatoria princeps RMCB-10]|nr:hypothetical protein [Oscillatoria princeps RMCB-10]